MTKTVATWFGVVLLVVGIMGFIPGITTDNSLFGVFAVNTANNIIHIVVGLLAIWMGMVGEDQSKNFFKVFGVIYALWAILGFISAEEPVLGFLQNNMATTILHVVIALVALYFGFAGVASRSGGMTGSSSTSTSGGSTT